MKLCGIIAALSPVLAGALVACSSAPPGIERVKEFNLLTTNYSGMSKGLTRAQTAATLYGAMLDTEKEDKLGQYYTIYWGDTEPELPVDLVFEYQQASTGSKVFTKTMNFPAGRKGGRQQSHFDFIGPEYKKGGTVMTWCATLKRAGQPLSRRTSYLWRDDTRS